MKQPIVLEDKEVRRIIANYLEVDENKITRLKYSYAIDEATGAEIKKIQDLGV